MPPKDKIIPVPMNENLLKRVEDYWHDNRIPSRAEAIRRLLEEALSKYEKKGKK